MLMHRQVYFTKIIFVRHQSNKILPCGEWFAMAGEMFEAVEKMGKWNFTSSRCNYENQDILVQHDVIAFTDGTKEAVMGVNNLKDGMIIKTETGAIPIK